MKQIIYITFLSISMLVFFGAKAAPKVEAKKPNFDSIRMETQNPYSKMYFPKLMEKYRKNDTVMTLEQYKNLYYGYAFQEDFDPYRKTTFTPQVDSLYFTNKHTKAQSDTIIKYAKIAIDNNPFDLKQMAYYIIALKEKKKNNLAAIWQYKLKNLIGAILSSGNGSEEKPWYVISPVHEYALLNFMNMVVEGHSTIEEENIDILKVNQTNTKLPSEYYFDFSLLIEGYEKKIAKLLETPDSN